MAEILGRVVHFNPAGPAREIFESIIISRFSLRDPTDEVLRTDEGTAFIERGSSRWKLSLSRPEILVPTNALPQKKPEDSEPDLVELSAAWYSAGDDDAARIPIRAAGNANIFRDLGAILVPKDFRIPVVTATRDNVGHYGLALIGDDEVVELRSPEYAMILAKYHYAANYRRDFLLEACGGGGYFVETHNFPHLHVPLTPDCGGFLIVGKRLRSNRFQFTGYRIPWGYALHTPANTIHGDGAIVGMHAISVASSTVAADTVLFYNENTLEMSRALIAPGE